MHKVWCAWLLMLGAFCGLTLPAEAAEFLAGNRVTVPGDQVHRGDLYVAGAQVVVDGHIEGDLIVAGGTVTIRGRVDGDVIGAGGTIEVAGPVGQAVRLVGGEVKLTSHIGGDLLVAGSRVASEPTTTVYGETVARAGELSLMGILGNSLRAEASMLRLAGTVFGPVSLQAAQLTVTPEAVINGRLRMQTASLNAIAPGAQIAGGVDAALWEPRSLWSNLSSIAFRLTTALLVGVVLLWLVPDATRRTGQLAERAPWLRMMLGLGVLIGGPLAAILVMLTVIGLPLGVLMLGLYGAALYLAQVAIAWTAGRALMTRISPMTARWQQVLALLIGLVLLHLAKSIPVAGPYVTFMIVIWGLGALMTLAYEGYQERRPIAR